MHMLGIIASNVLQVYSIGSLKIIEEEENEVEVKTKIRLQNRRTFQINPLEDDNDNQQRLRIKDSEIIEGFKS